MAGHFRTVPTAASKDFPGAPQFSGFMKPNRFEGEVNNPEIIGEIPAEINGTFYRVMPDPQFPPFVENDPVGYQHVRVEETHMLILPRKVVQRRWKH